ncbi:spermatogenesis associated 6-like protein [Leuresthes tenuis]|uniref:spermatogenesis associated 6-like protein n=1 Tax=Leuresthes tenuis TaxID=355514 RepID=UPI003B50FD75
MSRKALKVVVEIKFTAVSCPGVHLPAKNDIYLSMCFMGQHCQSESLPAVFPLLLHEKLTFEKIFRHAVDPRDIAVMLEYETVRIELVQLIPPVGDTLACFEEDARRFLFPEPKLVPPFSGVDREVLMIRARHFPGIAPRLEFSTKTSITECSPDAEVNIYSNTPMRPMIKRNSRHSSRLRATSPKMRHPQSHGGGRGDRVHSERQNTVWPLSYSPRSQSLSPLTDENTKHLAQLRPRSPWPIEWDTRTSQPMLASWPGARQCASPGHSAVFTSPSSPLTKFSSTVRRYPTARRKSFSSGLVGEISEGDSSSSEAHEFSDSHDGPSPSDLWHSYRERARHSRPKSSSHRAWEEVHDRVRGLLTTPKAVRRLAYGATVSEVDEVLARRSNSPGPQ